MKFLHNYTIPPSLLLTLLPTLTTPSPVTKQLAGSCPTHDYPTEPAYKAGYEAFCRDVPARNTQSWTINTTAATSATYYLTTMDNTPIRWTYSIKLIPNAMTHTWQTDEAMCLHMFKRVLEGAPVGEDTKPKPQWGGELGKHYCVVDGTGGDKDGTREMSGEGVVLVMGGTTEISGGSWDANAHLHFITDRYKGK